MGSIHKTADATQLCYRERSISRARAHLPSCVCYMDFSNVSFIFIINKYVYTKTQYVISYGQVDYLDYNKFY